MVKSSEKSTLPKMIANPYKNHSFGSAKSRCQNLIKHVVYEDFWMHFPETVKKGDRKALRFSLFLVAFLHSCESSLFP